MTPRSRHDRVSELLLEALELAEPQRDAFLTGACGDDEELRAEVESLLGYDDVLDEDFLEVPALRAIRRALRPAPEQLIPSRSPYPLPYSRSGEPEPR